MRFASRLRNLPLLRCIAFKYAILSVVLGSVAVAVPPVQQPSSPANNSSNWEYAVSFKDHITLYDAEWQEVGRAGMEFKEISSLIYDEIEDKLFITDMTSHDDVRVFELGRDANTNAYVTKENLAAKIHEDDTIRGITFDPLERVLYWIDETLRRIYTLDLTQTKAEPRVFLSFDHETPQAITLDVCRRFLYWTTHSDNGTTIERAPLTFNSTNNNTAAFDKRTVLVSDRLEKPVAIEIDQFSDKMFWIDIHRGTEVSVESANLHGGERAVLYDAAARELPSLIVEKERVIIMDSSNNCAFEMNKTANAKPKRLYCFKHTPRRIIKRPHFVEKHRNHPICQMVIERLEEQQQAMTVYNQKNSAVTKVSQSSSVVCLNGRLNDVGHCVCSTGWTGINCETKLCQNFCFHGTCAVGSNGFPLCHCDTGFTGERCEVERCNGYCLNDGRCELEGELPVCHCSSAFSGRHCEMINSRPVICRAYCEVGLFMPNIDWNIEDECSCNNSTSSEPLCSIRSSGGQIGGPNFIYIIVAAVLVTIVLIVVMVLGAIRHWYKPARPKIKKTYVVRKNVTPMTYRPAPQEQCEITIENCCNMQYCDTPCFDPKILVKDDNEKPTAAPKKDDKRDLLSNIVLDNSSDLF